jgi:crotonobetainyl-CoA:carnitine CoA-transferase CaiB-like acyl-CoA transferase
VSDEKLGDFLIQNMPIKFRNTENSASPWVADLGQHTDEVLAGELGLKQAEIDDLRIQNIVA